jgi:glucosamine--fructose-6-phosphate aminotransferase (isomerizing)
VIPALVARRSTNGAELDRGVPLDGRRVRRARSRSPRRRRPTRPAAARAAGKRPGAVRRLRDDAFVVASEPYGVVEECDRYLRLDGETMLDP